MCHSACSVVSAHRMRIFTIIILSLSSAFCLAQGNIKGQIKFCDNCRGINITKPHNDIIGLPVNIKTTKNRKGEIEIDSMIVPIRITQGNNLVSYFATNRKGEFELQNLEFGEYQLKININKYLKVDTVFNLSKRNSKIEIILDDRMIWRYVDSTQLAKYPYSPKQAKSDIENGIVKVLSYGLAIIPHDQLDSIATKYGFEYEGVAGCVVGSYERKAIDSYNQVVFDYLDKTNPPDWRDKLKADIQATFRNQYTKEER